MHAIGAHTHSRQRSLIAGEAGKTQRRKHQVSLVLDLGTKMLERLGEETLRPTRFQSPRLNSVGISRLRAAPSV